nr:DUF3885 domain-containing protein [uncultured Anaerotignum sp.]
MLLEKVSQTLNRIGNERLQLPIFYESPVALRFETGDPSLDIFLDKVHLNPTYLRGAFWRVSLLYEKAKPFDTLLWVLYRTPDLETDVDAIIERFCMLTHLPTPAEVYQQQVTTADEEPMVRIFLLWDMRQTPPRIAPLLKGILSADFKGFQELSSAVFFFDTERHLLLHPYDDRGADVVAEKAETIRFLYQDCKNWLLSYDFERMKAIFEA